MFHKILTVSLLSIGCFLSGFEIDSGWQIVCPADAVPTERKAAKETAAYIKKVSGLDLKIVPSAAGKPSIVIRKNTELPEEAWDVRRIPEGLLISGGVPNGVLYGCYEFIERGLGCRFLSFDAEYIPAVKKIILPDDFKLSGKPFFRGRSIYRGYLVNGGAAYQVRLKLNGANFEGPEWGGYERYVNHQSSHTYYLYSSKFPADKTEWLSLSTEGKRLRAVNGMGPGQLCLTNLEARDFIFKEMKARIERERAQLKKAGTPFSKIISLTANDNNMKCVCGNCLAAAKKYGSYSGVMLEFTNDLAARLEKVFPEMLVESFAYEYTENAPKSGISPRKNVLLCVAQLGDEYYSVSKFCRDSLRSLKHPNNRLAFNELMEWSKFRTPIRVWDYWVLYNQRRNFPYTAIPAITDNLRIYADNGITRFFAEAECLGGERRPVVGRSFTDLSIYLGAKLLVDPYADPETIIADFMKHYYGPAAVPMKRLLDHLVKAMENEKSTLGRAGIGAGYLTKEFFEDAEKLFAEAEKAAGNDPVILDRIGEERTWFDEAALDLQKRRGLKFDRDQVLERYCRNYRKVFRRYASEKLVRKLQKKVDVFLDNMGKQVPLPKQFEGKNVFDFPLFTLKSMEYIYTRLIDDPEAAGGTACILSLPPKIRKEDVKAFHEKDFQMGVYSLAAKKRITGKTYPRNKIFKDEKYHWYFLGKGKLTKNCKLWVHWSWKMPFSCISGVYDPVQPEAEYGFWVSVKLQGPAYVPGSQKENAVLVDRIIVTRE